MIGERAVVPVYLKTPDGDVPGDPLYYVVAANGTFLVRNTALFTATIPATDVVGLERQQEGITIHFPPIPRLILEHVIGFFRTVYDRWDGEAIAFLYYAPELKEFRVEIPPQTLPRYRSRGRWRTEGRLEYGCLPRPDGFLKLGDMHSHGDAPAFFSGTDDRDDREDGLRIVIGRLDRTRIEMRASFVVNRLRFPVGLSDVIETPSGPFALVAPPDDWMRQVVCRYEASYLATDCSRGDADDD